MRLTWNKNNFTPDSYRDYKIKPNLQAEYKTEPLPFKFTISKFLVFILLTCSYKVSAQQVIRPVNSTDTIRIIRIVQGKNLRMLTIDSATILETIAGNVIIKEGLTTFYCDSAAINRKTNILEAFGNIHINDNDSIHTYAQYLRYVGAERIAWLKKNVKLTDKKGTLYTDDLEYNLRTGIATYKNGGRIVNEKTVLESAGVMAYSPLGRGSVGSSR